MILLAISSNKLDMKSAIFHFSRLFLTHAVPIDSAFLNILGSLEANSIRNTDMRS